MVRIVSDSSCDIRAIKSMAGNLSIDFVPLKMTIDNVDFIDDDGIDVEAMYKAMSECTKASTTTCPSPDDYERAYEGADEIYVITISSSLSGSYNSANLAKQMHLEKYPDKKIYVFDSLSTSGSMALTIYKINELVAKGKSFEDICTIVDDYKVNHTDMVFVLHSVENLVRNGRLNKIVGAAINALGIKIIGRASDEGKLEPLAKVRSKAKVLKTFMTEMEDKGYNGGKVVIAHACNLDDAKTIEKMIKDKYENADIEIVKAKGLVSYYAEEKGILIGYEH